MTDTKVVAFDASSGSVSREKLEQAVAAALDRKKEGKEQGVFLETHVGHVLPAKIPLKHPMPPSSDNKLLFIVGAEKEAVLKRLSKAGIRAASVIMINEIRKSWTPEREADLRSHDAIYADSSLFPRLLKIQKDFPVVPIDFSRTDLKSQLGAGQAFTISPLAQYRLSVRIGSTTEDAKNIVKNLEAVIPQVVKNAPVSWTSALTLYLHGDEEKGRPKEKVEGAPPSREQIQAAVKDVLTKTGGNKGATIWMNFTSLRQTVEVKLAHGPERTSTLLLRSGPFSVNVATGALSEGQIVDNITGALPHIIPTIPGGWNNVKFSLLAKKSKTGDVMESGPAGKAGQTKNADEMVVDEQADAEMTKEAQQTPPTPKGKTAKRKVVEADAPAAATQSTKKPKVAAEKPKAEASPAKPDPKASKAGPSRKSPAKKSGK
ncbi:hypothetical protein DFJ73DRAFT_808103 [Zopfochytrium polystomum]|nr:hypothetical protein DFJ73DRAFT_808103 [Zopfochytrium polystomum]